MTEPVVMLTKIVRGYAEQEHTTEAIVATLLDDYPDLVLDYVAHFRYRVMSEFVRGLLDSDRASARASAARMTRAKNAHDRFQELVASETILPSAMTFLIDWDGTRKPLGLMDRADLKFVASRYAETARHATAWQQTLTSLARRVPAGKTVSQVFTEEQLIDIVGKTVLQREDA